jgi:hypothetical protein
MRNKASSIEPIGNIENSRIIIRRRSDQQVARNGNRKHLAQLRALHVILKEKLRVNEIDIEGYLSEVNLFLANNGYSPVILTAPVSRRKTPVHPDETVGYITPIRIVERKDRTVYWLCRCEGCGNEYVYPANRVLRGNHCGCQSTKRRKKDALPYPDNLYKKLFGNDKSQYPSVDDPLTLFQGCLTARQYEAISLCYKDGMTRKAASEKLGMTRQAIQDLVSKGLRKICVTSNRAMPLP